MPCISIIEADDMSNDDDFATFRQNVQAGAPARTGQTEDGLRTELMYIWQPVFDAVTRMNQEARAASENFSVKLGHQQVSLLGNKMIIQVVASKGGPVQHAFDLLLRHSQLDIEDKSDKKLTGGTALTFKAEPLIADGMSGDGKQGAARELTRIIGIWFRDTHR